MKKIVFSVFICFLLCSCSKSYYQIYTADCIGITKEDSALVYENKDCKISYCLWGEKGNFGFLFYNKTESDIFIILPQTFFIKNGVAYDFFKNREYTSSTSFAEASLYYSESKVEVKNKISESIKYKEMCTICIPPRSSKKVIGYFLLDKVYGGCDNAQLYPKKKFLVDNYTKGNSPLVYRNKIAYSFDKNGDSIKNIENEFWVSCIMNYSRKGAGHITSYKDCRTGAILKEFIIYDEAPNRFYNRYKKNFGLLNDANRY